MAPLGSMIASAGAASLAARGFSYHNNWVTFYGPNWVTEANFQVTDLMISAGQDPQTYNHVGDIHLSDNSIPGNASLVFVVGRHKTSEVAQWWNERVPATKTTFGHTAGQLNFAFIGNLQVNVKHVQPGQPAYFNIPSVGLAQGSDDNGSNWWFGGSTCAYTVTGVAQCNATDDTGRPYKVEFDRGQWTAIDQVAIGYAQPLWSDPRSGGE